MMSWPSFPRLRASRRDLLVGIPALALLLAGLTAFVFVPYAPAAPGTGTGQGGPRRR